MLIPLSFNFRAIFVQFGSIKINFIMKWVTMDKNDFEKSIFRNIEPSAESGYGKFALQRLRSSSKLFELDFMCFTEKVKKNCCKNEPTVSIVIFSKKIFSIFILTTMFC